MKIELNWKRKECIVTREPNDKPIPYSGWAKEGGGDPSSRLFYRIQQILNEEEGYGLVKKRMWKDGHLTDEYRQYLVTRNRKGGNFCIYDNFYAVRDAREEYNKKGEVTLQIETDDEWKGE